MTAAEDGRDQVSSLMQPLKGAPVDNPIFIHIERTLSRLCGFKKNKTTTKTMELKLGRKNGRGGRKKLERKKWRFY